ncbi:MAG: UDP-glucose 6-dehydrogenase [Acidobacteriaceae bacterium]|nr:UDP-glucose 6-dehydrogenase [Acidobacteriaceae bacterium]
MKISVVGAGYVGLTTAACLAELGHHVFCAESDVRKLAMLRAGELPFFEPYLDDIVVRNRAADRLEFGATEEAIHRSDVIFICVGTPPLENGEADLSAIETVARSVAKLARGYRLIVEKSTVPVQTARQLRKYLALQNSNHLTCDIVSNPEFLREGSAVEDFFHPDRIVVGVEEIGAAEQMREIYRPVLEKTVACPVHRSCSQTQEARFVVTDTNSAELIKHASNSFLATKISFINMVADLCEAAGADIGKVAEGIGLDSRIGPSFLRPGIGFGGFCFPKDLQAFVRIAEKFGCDFNLLKEVERINHRRVVKFVEKIKNELWVLRGKRVCVWGLAFKPETDDVRFAPPLAIIRNLLAEGATVRAYDPEAMQKASRELTEVTFCRDLYDAAERADVIVLLTEWQEFQRADWTRLSGLVERALIIDGRNTLPIEDVVASGFQYVGIGGVARSPETVEVAVAV